MRKLFGMVSGMLSALVLWQAVMAFLGTGLVVSGLYAGFSLLAFSVSLFIGGAMLVKPKEKDA